MYTDEYRCIQMPHYIFNVNITIFTDNTMHYIFSKLDNGNDLRI